MSLRTRRPIFSSSTQSTVFGWTASIQFTVVSNCIRVLNIASADAAGSGRVIVFAALTTKVALVRVLLRNRALGHAENVVDDAMRHIIKELQCAPNNYYQPGAVSWTRMWAALLRTAASKLS